MRFMPWLENKKAQILRRIAPKARPTTATLGYPPFSERVKDRNRRWTVGGEGAPYDYLVGKTSSQAFMRDLGYPVPEFYARFPRITALPPLDSLPSAFALKPEHGKSAQNVFTIKNGINLLDGTPTTREDIIAKVGPDHPEQFHAEELLLNFDGSDRPANDVKFHCFGGQIAFVQFIERNSATDHHKNRYWYLNKDWTLLGIRMNTRVYPERTVPPKPDCYPEMLEIVRDVGRRLNMYLRIDMYATTRGPVFGEFTPFPAGGLHYSVKAEAWLGSLWKGLEGCAPLADTPRAEPLRKIAR